MKLYTCSFDRAQRSFKAIKDILKFQLNNAFEPGQNSGFSGVQRLVPETTYGLCHVYSLGQGTILFHRLKVDRINKDDGGTKNSEKEEYTHIRAL